MAKALVYNERMDGVLRQNNWRMILGGEWGDGHKYTNRMKYWDAIDPRSRYTYEAITTSPAMTMPKPGKAQLYIGKFEDEDGQRLQGGNNYVIRVEKDVPANLFWSIVIYDADTRTIIDNRAGAAGWQGYGGQQDQGRPNERRWVLLRAAGSRCTAQRLGGQPRADPARARLVPLHADVRGRRIGLQRRVQVPDRQQGQGLLGIHQIAGSGRAHLARPMPLKNRGSAQDEARKKEAPHENELAEPHSGRNAARHPGEHRLGAGPAQRGAHARRQHGVR
jgi:hypothetical protein